MPAECVPCMRRRMRSINIGGADRKAFKHFGEELIIIKYEKHFPKMYGDVGMAVPKTTQTRYMDGSVQATQMTTQVTPSLHHFSFLLSTQISFQYSDNKA